MAQSFEPLTPKRRRQQTRDYLLRAAAKVFAERGFHGASLDEVAAAAGFSKGAVYSNFKNKDDLFMALLESRYDQDLENLRTAIATTATGPHNEQLDVFVDLLREGFFTYDEDWARLYQEFYVYAMRNPEARTRLAQAERAGNDSIAEIIRAEERRHGYPLHEPPEQTARIVSALTRGLLIMWLIDEQAVDQSLLEAAVGFISRAMTPPSAQRPSPPASGDKAPARRDQRRK